MKAQKIIYSVTTGLVVLGMVMSFFNYFFNPAMKEGYAHIGFPDWFRVELGIAKLLGALALAIPAVPQRVKEWAYAGFFINFLSATFAHYFAGDAAGYLVAPVLMLMLLVASYVAREKLGLYRSGEGII
ncbi:DoxX family protein [Dyadobacter sandarakinus]|uniref:DoxX family protein n=1 Tax=Dyadobacter sandarakinus TaxID=2747268 RepID=A0ABX7I3K3_9BACT|nr:DoxX family protein [Dyadobacter sandarakinus]QRQ99822.1 DoxX family protein [Dyadobacter sandarakinus]